VRRDNLRSGERDPVRQGERLWMRTLTKSELERIPGVGKNMARHLRNIGYSTIESLKGQDPEEIYIKDCSFQGRQVDRCALYVYRLAVWFAENEEKSLDPEKLKWWNWKD
jgi:hypothetical protein